MTKNEIIKQCDEVINSRAGQHISLVLSGKWGKTNKRKLCKGGPVGEIVSDNFSGPGIIVLFDAVEVRKFLANQSLEGTQKNLRPSAESLWGRRWELTK